MRSLDREWQLASLLSENRWILLTRTMFGSALVSLAVPAAALAADLSGTWLVQAAPAGQQAAKLVCILQADGQNLFGPCAAVQGRILPTTGHTDGNLMEFKYSTDYNGSGVRLDYTGRVQPDGKVKGPVTTGAATGLFVATQVQNSESEHTKTWTVDSRIGPQFKYLLVCTFKSSGERFRGPCVATDGPTLRTTGTLNGTTIEFGYDLGTAGQPAHVAYAGSIQPDGTLSGTIRGGGTFTASRQ